MICDLEDEIRYIGRVADCAEDLNSPQRVVLLFTSSSIRLKLRSDLTP